jgi:Tol biopolymer transport system component
MKTFSKLATGLFYVVLLAAFGLLLNQILRTVVNGSPAAPGPTEEPSPPPYPAPTERDRSPYPFGTEFVPTEIGWDPAYETEPPMSTGVSTTELARLGPQAFRIPSPTMVPFPFGTPTVPPGPTVTPIPFKGPAADAQGTLVYLWRAGAKSLGVERVVMDQAGKPTAAPVRLAVEVTQIGYYCYLSPDGSRVACFHYYGEGSGMTAYQIEGEKIDLLQPDRFSSINWLFGWHPDSLRILVNNGRHLWLLDSTTGIFTLLARPRLGDPVSAAVSPDGTRIVYAVSLGNSDRPDQIWLVDVYGQGARLLHERSAHDLSWSPDGAQIVFYDAGWMAMNADGSDLRTIADLPYWRHCPAGKPAWSPDSRTVAVITTAGSSFECNFWNEKAFEGRDIYLIDVQSGASRPLLPDGSTRNIFPAWSPDGSKIAFASDRSGTGQIWVVSPDGSGLEQVSASEQFVTAPVWVKP